MIGIERCPICTLSYPANQAPSCKHSQAEWDKLQAQRYDAEETPSCFTGSRADRRRIARLKRRT